MDEDVDLAWAAGLLIGEGHVGRVSNKRYWYFYVALQMYDERAVRRFADILGLSFAGPYRNKNRDHDYYRAYASGRTAEMAIGRLWPHIKDTDKGDQAMRWAEHFDVVPWVTGEVTTPRPRGHRWDDRRHRGD